MQTSSRLGQPAAATRAMAATPSWLTATNKQTTKHPYRCTTTPASFTTMAAQQHDVRLCSSAWSCAPSVALQQRCTVVLAQHRQILHWLRRDQLAAECFRSFSFDATRCRVRPWTGVARTCAQEPRIWLRLKLMSPLLDSCAACARSRKQQVERRGHDSSGCPGQHGPRADL